MDETALLVQRCAVAEEVSYSIFLATSNSKFAMQILQRISTPDFNSVTEPSLGSTAYLFFQDGKTIVCFDIQSL